MPTTDTSARTHNTNMKADELVTVLANRIHELERRVQQQRRRIDTLERTKRRQRELLDTLYWQLRNHRANLRYARQSRDMWRHRCMVETGRHGLD